VDWLEALRQLDLTLLREARAVPGWALTVFHVFTVIGAGWGLFLLVPFVIRKASRRTTLWLFAALMVTNTTVSSIKWLVGRTRPCDSLEWCNPIHITSPGGGSFPSGHAAGAFAFAVFVSMRVPAFAPVGLLYAVLVAWSRSVLGVHYPSDVLAGSVLGTAIAVVSVLLLRWRERAAGAASTTPSALPEGKEGEEKSSLPPGSEGSSRRV
jgi:undecaprenyl-diphosphatase